MKRTKNGGTRIELWVNQCPKCGALVGVSLRQRKQAICRKCEAAYKKLK